jgi:hypothetical protein
MLCQKGFFFLFLLALTICGCAVRHDIQPAFASPDSGIRGRLVSTTGPASGTVNVTTADQKEQVATIDTDSGGDFAVGLRPGKYYVYTQTFEGMFYGRRIAVAPRQMTYMELRLPPQWP